MCTLRNFPNLIEHCIEWARAKFTGFFTDEPSDVLQWLEDSQDFLKRAESESANATIERLENNLKLMKIK
jgi:ubiquitin-activating enzyme E1